MLEENILKKDENVTTKMAVLIIHDHPSLSQYTELTQILARCVFIFRMTTSLKKTWLHLSSTTCFGRLRRPSLETQRKGEITVWPSRSCQQPVNITHDYTNCCLYRLDPPDVEQQACSKHVEVYYWNKLIENGASCWFMLYGYITIHCQQNIKPLKHSG